MNYIGSKQKLAPWNKDTINSVFQGNLKESTFADIFSGTGQISRIFKNYVKKLIVNDLESYSFILNSHYIGNTTFIDEPIISTLPYDGLIYNNFSPKSTPQRKYFTVDNAKIIDGIRLDIQNQFNSGTINLNQYHWSLASLIEAADKVANTASVYGAFLKNFKKTALKNLDFQLLPYQITNQNKTRLYNR